MNQISAPPEEAQEEKPLDPAVERVRAKMMRLLVVSMTIMFISIFAVLAAVVYRINSDTTDTLIRADLAVPEAFQVLESGLGDGSVYIRGVLATGAMQVLIFNPDTGALVRELTIRHSADALPES
ncbi:MAG: DUF6476 family protein [Pseudomonadota bacterium]